MKEKRGKNGVFILAKFCSFEDTKLGKQLTKGRISSVLDRSTFLIGVSLPSREEGSPWYCWKISTPGERFLSSSVPVHDTFSDVLNNSRIKGHHELGSHSSEGFFYWMARSLTTCVLHSVKNSFPGAISSCPKNNEIGFLCAFDFERVGERTQILLTLGIISYPQLMYKTYISIGIIHRRCPQKRKGNVISLHERTKDKDKKMWLNRPFGTCTDVKVL